MVEAIKFYAVEPIAGIGMPIIITTAMTEDNDFWMSEYFILMPSQDPGHTYHSFNFSARTVPPDLLEIDMDFMLTEAIGQARLQLFIDHLDKISDEQRGYARQSEIKESDQNLIVSYWMRESDECRNQVKQILEETHCGDLKRLLGMVVVSPTFVRS